MKYKSPIKVFIGSGEASLIERKVAIYSLKKHSSHPLEVYVFNGTHNSIEIDSNEPISAPLSLRLKYRNTTEFSLYRYLIPEVCGHQGKAIYIDSDVICLSDIVELFESSVEGYDFLAKSEAYSSINQDMWGLSVLLIDCEKCYFDLELFCDEIDQNLYSMTDFSCMTSRFLSHHPYKIGCLDPNWNSFDQWDKNTKLIHYTNLHKQPWKHTDHPYEELWFEYFEEAIAAGFISQRDIQLSIDRSYVRRDILTRKSMKGLLPLRQAFSVVKHSMTSWLKS